MKKVFQILLMLLLVSTLVACGESTSKKKFTVTYNVDGGSPVQAEKVESGKLASEPDDPKKDGFVFDGWYKESTFNTQFEFTTPITADITLYAKWGFDPTTFEKYLASTARNYQDSSSGNLLITIIDGTETTTLEYLYNFIGSDVDGLSLVYKSGAQTIETYVKDGRDYVNIDGEKTYSIVSNATHLAIVTDYGFDGFTGEIFNLIDKSIFNASSIVSDQSGVAVLQWDKSKYQLITDHLPDDDIDAIFEATQRFNQIEANIKSIEIKLTYANNRVTKLESTWVNKDNVTKKVMVEFRGLDTQTISYPSDLSSYVLRK